MESWKTITNDKELRRKYGLTEDNYGDFKDYYLKKHNCNSFSTFKELQKFIESSESTDVIKLEYCIEKWSADNRKRIEELEIIESFLQDEMNKYLEILNSHGIIYDVRNLMLGDSKFFPSNEDTPLFIEPDTFSIDITDFIEKDSILDVKKSLVKDKVFVFLSNLITSKINSNNLISERSINIIYEDLMIEVNKKVESEVAVVVRMGIK